EHPFEGRRVELPCRRDERIGRLLRGVEAPDGGAGGEDRCRQAHPDHCCCLHGRAPRHVSEAFARHRRPPPREPPPPRDRPPPPPLRMPLDRMLDDPRLLLARALVPLNRSEPPPKAPPPPPPLETSRVPTRSAPPPDARLPN